MTKRWVGPPVLAEPSAPFRLSHGPFLPLPPAVDPGVAVCLQLDLR